MADFLQSAAQAAVQRVIFRSQITPEFSYDPWASYPQEPPAESAWLMNFVRPSITVETPAGPVVVEPWGPPERDYTGVAAAGGLASLIALVLAIGFVARRF